MQYTNGYVDPGHDPQQYVQMNMQQPQYIQTVPSYTGMDYGLMPPQQFQDFMKSMGVGIKYPLNRLPQPIGRSPPPPRDPTGPHETR